jgi:carbamoyl-phosphate synthase large subunit
MTGMSLEELGVAEAPRPAQTSVKESVFPFTKFPGVDVILGPEMRSTGEVMGFDDSFGMAFAKAQLSAGNVLPTEPGKLIVTVNDTDKKTITPILRRFTDLGFEIHATRGTYQHLTRLGIPAQRVFKVNEGRPNIVDMIVSGDVALLINTPLGKTSQFDDYAMRRAAIAYNTPYLTTMSATSAACDALIALKSRTRTVRSLQERVAAALELTAERE